MKAQPPIQVQQPPGMGLGDVYYVLFRHKWRILVCSLLGAAAALVYYKFFPPPFQSEAKLFIRYVITDNKAVGPGSDGAAAKSPDQRGETIMDSEMEILTSMDLAKQVAEAVGPEKILAKVGGGKDVNKAALFVNRGLIVDIPPMSSVIRITFIYPDATVVQPVLSAVIDSYLKMHVEIHRAVGIVGDFLSQETDTLRSSLNQTEDDLRKALNKAGIISLEDAKKTFVDQSARLRQEIFSATAELAERTAVFQQITKAASAPQAASSTPAPSAAPLVPEPEPLPAQVLDDYRNVSARLSELQKKEQELLIQFTGESPRVRDIRDQIAEASAQKKKLEDANPQLVKAVPAVSSSSAPPTAGSPANAYDPAAEAAHLNALQVKIKVLNSQLDELRAQQANVDQMEGTILELRRKKELQESNYRYFAGTLEQSRINEALGNGRVSNISVIQTPAPAFNDLAKNHKKLAMIGMSGLIAGIAWAFLIELFLDRSVRRPIDVERMLHLPLFLSIPKLGRNGQKRLQESTGERSSLQKVGAAASPPNPAENSELAVLDEAQALHPFHETLRDRLIGYFESRNLTHKPKLVAVTGLGKNAGVTTTAAGLASCLSETGDGNVLLVDLTPGQGSAQQFYQGKAVCGLEEILATRGNAHVQDNLYVVAEGGERLSRALPQRFSKLIPQLKASNFDYIIFDMPPVSQISITPRLAGFMDMVLLVIESEKTDRDLVQRATSLLAESKAHVGAVLNKTRNFVPARLHQEYLGNT